PLSRYRREPRSRHGRDRRCRRLSQPLSRRPRRTPLQHADAGRRAFVGRTRNRRGRSRADRKSVVARRLEAEADRGVDAVTLDLIAELAFVTERERRIAVGGVEADADERAAIADAFVG